MTTGEAGRKGKGHRYKAMYRQKPADIKYLTICKLGSSGSQGTGDITGDAKLMPLADFAGSQQLEGYDGVRGTRPTALCRTDD